MKRPTTLTLLKQWWQWYAIEHQLLLRQQHHAAVCLKRCAGLKMPVVAAFDSKTGLSVAPSSRKLALQQLHAAGRWSPALRLTPIFCTEVIQLQLLRARSVKSSNDAHGFDYALSSMLQQIYQRRVGALRDMLNMGPIDQNDSSIAHDADKQRVSVELANCMHEFEEHPRWLADGRPYAALKRALTKMKPSNSPRLDFVSGNASAPRLPPQNFL